MKSIIYLTVALSLVAISASGEQQRILRRVIKSTPTASNLGRIRLVTVRSTSDTAERGAVAEITGKEAASFGQRSANETIASPTSPNPSGLKSKQPTTTTTTSTTTSTTSAPTTTQTAELTSTSTPTPRHRASDRQQAAEVELLSSAPSSWQAMSAIEAPAAMLIATGARAASSSSSSSDLSSSSSNEEYAATGDFLRSGSVKSGSYIQSRQQSGLKQAQQQQQQQQSYFYPQQRASTTKTSNYQAATKTNWYQTPSTTPRPAPIVQQRYEQQNEQYVEQQQQVEYGAAPLGQAEPFAFDFKTEDNSGNGQYRKEESDKNGVVRGSYGYTDANGIYRHVEYIADQNGFRANIKSNEPGLMGETQPASIQFAGRPAATAQPNQRYSADNSEWNSAPSSQSSSGPSEAALAPPDFESSHKSDRLRAAEFSRS